MKNNGKQNGRFPRGWDETRIRAVIAHYENQTMDERLAEISSAAVADSWRRVGEAIKLFNKSCQSKLHIVRNRKPDEGDRDESVELAELFGECKFCELNWDGPEGSTYYRMEFAEQHRIPDIPFRPVVCKISTRLAPTVKLPASKSKLLEVLAACVDGVKLEVKDDLPIVLRGVSTIIYPRSVDADLLCDALVRLNHSMHNLREAFGSRKAST